MKALAALAFALASCGGDAWSVDDRFSPEEEQELRRGAEVWRRLGQDVELEFGVRASESNRGAKQIVIVGPRAMENLSRGLGRDKVAVGIHEEDSRGFDRRIAIRLDRVGPDVPLWFVLAHELGHSFGMLHVDDPTAIMGNPYGGNVGCAVRSDVLELCRVQGCLSRHVGCDELEAAPDSGP